jgi:DNA repair photolyase
MARIIQAKTILSHIKSGTDTWFGLRYNMNLYRGCQHGCIYCDSRSLCYQLGELSDIRIKENAIELLEKELKSKRNKGTIGFGSMNDPYMPIEKSEELTRKALALVSKYRFPIHIITKSNLVVRDIDLLKKISEVYAAITFTITTADDKMSLLIESGAPVSSSRFSAMEQLSREGIYTGITLMPVLPFITDDFKNLKDIAIKAKENGAGYILVAMGMTIREGQREHYYNELDKKFPGIKERYIQAYGNNYQCNAPEADKLWSQFKVFCDSLSIPLKMKFYQPIVYNQLSLFK